MLCLTTSNSVCAYLKISRSKKNVFMFSIKPFYVVHWTKNLQRYRLLADNLFNMITNFL